jgi:hypothetical protein
MKLFYYLSLRPLGLLVYSGERRKQRDWLDSASNGRALVKPSGSAGPPKLRL